MGNWKKIQIPGSSGNQFYTPGPNPSVFGRNLTKDQLGGVIFGCKNATIKECLTKQLFGLPAAHFSYVKHIQPGLPLFLFNYTDRMLHGVFEAAGNGRMNIDRYGWTGDGKEMTQFPAQVQIRVQLHCRPLSEDKFRHAIADNYYHHNHFWFELDHGQTTHLIALLQPQPQPTTPWPHPRQPPTPPSPVKTPPTTPPSPTSPPLAKTPPYQSPPIVKPPSPPPVTTPTSPPPFSSNLPPHLATPISLQEQALALFQITFGIMRPPTPLQ